MGEALKRLSPKRLWRLVRDGRGLAHRPIVFPARRDVRVVLESPALHAPLDVSDAHVPVSLRPLVLGVRGDPALFAGADDARVSLAFTLAADGTRFGTLEARRIGAIALAGGALHLLRPTRCRNRCDAPLRRWWRYALAWRHARRSAARGDRLGMSARDLRALDLYYSVARPVYLVGVAHERRSNLFPMDLVGAVGAGDFLLALRATSPAVELMEASRRIVLSAAPADRLAAVYALGAHHKRATVDTTSLPFAVAPSPALGLPSLPGRLAFEVDVADTHRVGSHVLFVARVVGRGDGSGPQLAHVSESFLRWARARGAAFDPAT